MVVGIISHSRERHTSHSRELHISHKAHKLLLILIRESIILRRQVFRIKRIKIISSHIWMDIVVLFHKNLLIVHSHVVLFVVRKILIGHSVSWFRCHGREICICLNVHIAKALFQ